MHQKGVKRCRKVSKGVKKSLKGVEKPLKCVKKRQKVSKRRPKGDQKAAFKRRPKGDKKVSKSDQRCQNKKDVGHREMGGIYIYIYIYIYNRGHVTQWAQNSKKW